MTPESIFTLQFSDIVSIIGPILTSFVFGAKMLIKSIDSRLETHSIRLNAIENRCSKNHKNMPENGNAYIEVQQ